uniref:3'-5' exonuclease domain-containing protein n=1 Tax=Timema bartmani TaxID=61472 RepID=A0A7R9F1R4_9NEOP|nr:unnamed protein product [Timema bartmani]
MDKHFIKGQRLLVKTDMGTVEGDLFAMNSEHTKISLKNVATYPEGKKMSGLVNFFKNEVIDVLLLEADLDTKKKVLIPEDTFLMKNISSQPVQQKIHTKELNNPTSHKNINTSQNSGRILESPTLRGIEFKILRSLLTDYKGKSTKKRLVETLMREPFIALDYDGAENGRKSDIRLLIIASSKKIFLFDILTLGSAAFDSGLRKILESPNAVAFLVEKEMTGQEAKFTKSLAQTLKDVLHMPKDLIFERLVRLGYVEEDNARWHKRPLDADLECQIIKNVPYLFLLHEKLLSVYMERLNNAISINLEVREANETERKEIEDMGHKFFAQKMQLLNVQQCINNGYKSRKKWLTMNRMQSDIITKLPRTFPPRRIWETLSPLLPSPSLPLPSVDPSIWFVPELDQEYKTWEPVCHRSALLCKISSKEELRNKSSAPLILVVTMDLESDSPPRRKKKPHQN